MQSLSHFDYLIMAVYEYEARYDYDYYNWKRRKCYDEMYEVYTHPHIKDRHIIKTNEEYFYVYKTEGGMYNLQTALRDVHSKYKPQPKFKTEYRTKSQKRFDEYMKTRLSVNNCADI